MALIHAHFHSNILKLAVSMDAIIPEPAQPADEGRRYPVLYLLHGLSDDHTIWQRRTSIERYVADMDLAVVMPAADRSWYTDMDRGPKYWTYITQEIPTIARHLFPISAQPQDTFVAGLSMGGYGALKMALTHPEQFAAAASLSGAVDIAAIAEDVEQTD
ncbi:MAG: alpha/beta hydrolase, partial [Armatimonadota bacterium]